MANIYTAEMGQPPMEEDSGILDTKAARTKAKPARSVKSRPDPRDANIYTEDKGAPPMESDSGILTKPSKKPAKYAGGGSVCSASKRADGIAQRGKTRGKML